MPAGKPILRISTLSFRGRLQFLKERGLSITFFIVGQDAALEKNREAIASIAAAGHEIGNHSFNHEPWLHLYSKEEIVESSLRPKKR